ncbi:MAG TPA: hypothetical protein DEV93_03415 [Chloroflexi bacterium]|jgi:hypothetical protein|nr:hypothetical protein [Chloroflexota bacterium]
MSKGTTKRAVRIDDALWLPALTLAKERGDNLSDIIRNAIRAYVEEWGTE